MCWSVIFEGGKRAESRDELEAIIGAQSIGVDGDDRTENDHCLCSVDVEKTLAGAGFSFRDADCDDDFAGFGAFCGDTIAYRK